MKDRIRQRALELGFDRCRFTSALPPASGPRLQEWLAAGRHGEMGWMQRNVARRLDPDLVLPGARGVVCLAVSYHHPESATAGGHGTPGMVARYARHQDYHDLLRAPLTELSRFVDEVSPPGTRSLWYVDTGPILERDLAQRAGLGFVGKHTGLVSRELGNWVLLAEILTTTPFEEDSPEGNRCGRCTRCIAACPTEAIVAPFQLDARRCISYLTIELKGSIPVELRRSVGDRIFGCDDCLAACPWNRFAREGSLMKRGLRPDLVTPGLESWLSLDEPGFRRLFEGTPLLRSRRRGLLRNVCVALGNVGTTSSLPALSRAASDPEPLIAEHARWAIAEIEARAGSQSRGAVAPGV